MFTRFSGIFVISILIYNDEMSFMSIMLALVIYMKYYRNLSYTEIGGFLGLTKSGVDTRLQRARARLKAVLGQKGINYEL